MLEVVGTNIALDEAMAGGGWEEGLDGVGDAGRGVLVVGVKLGDIELGGLFWNC